MAVLLQAIVTSLFTTGLISLVGYVAYRHSFLGRLLSPQPVIVVETVSDESLADMISPTPPPEQEEDVVKVE